MAKILHPDPRMISERASEIFERAKIVARHYQRCDVELLRSIDEIRRGRVYVEYRCSFHELCLQRLRLPLGAVKCAVNVLNKSKTVPELRQAVEEGLELTKARTIVPVITPENQAEWIERARQMSKSKLERAVASVNPIFVEFETVKPSAADRNKIEFYTSNARLDVLRRAQELVSNSAQTAVNLDETIARAVAEYVIKHDPVVRADKNAGRSNASLKTIVFARDRGQCQMKIDGERRCGNRRFLHLHHRRAKYNLGTNHPNNLTTLCAGCHRAWHQRYGDVPLFEGAAHGPSG